MRSHWAGSSTAPGVTDLTGGALLFDMDGQTRTAPLPEAWKPVR